MKHLVDKYNLVRVYSTTEISDQTHKLAIKLVIFSVVMIQLFQTTVHLVRSVLCYLVFVKLPTEYFPEILMKDTTSEPTSLVF